MLITDLLNFHSPTFSRRKRRKPKTQPTSPQNKLIPLQTPYILFLHFQITKRGDKLEITRGCSLTRSRQECCRWCINKIYLSAATLKNKPSERVMTPKGFKEHVGIVR